MVHRRRNSRALSTPSSSLTPTRCDAQPWKAVAELLQILRSRWLRNKSFLTSGSRPHRGPSLELQANPVRFCEACELGLALACDDPGAVVLAPSETFAANNGFMQAPAKTSDEWVAELDLADRAVALVLSLEAHADEVGSRLNC